MPSKSKKKSRSPSPSSSRTSKKNVYSTMSYKEIQNLAKKRGINANLGREKLLEQLYLSDKPGIKISPRRKSQYKIIYMIQSKNYLYQMN